MQPLPLRFSEFKVKVTQSVVYTVSKLTVPDFKLMPLLQYDPTPAFILDTWYTFIHDVETSCLVLSPSSLHRIGWRNKAEYRFFDIPPMKLWGSFPLFDSGLS